MPLLNLRMARPEIVVDLSRINSGLDGLAIDENTVTVGATCRVGKSSSTARWRGLAGSA